ncbi:DUF1289 domain-containing protein [Rhizorhabdus dicambivorans]|uniref:DUF1289 domain-containing protein n=1 Tax=Rhizorhabdus dicambivorans TaxID=1850238 RepID=A0A2A4G3H3_9SPHN|nr:DUF1289 domain-containing protein [Rhizorhabdus dicambivorans]ATE65087.1 DUF1289 domain-containing protein [Rhizorhabdus dicambivorans]PCE44360.1 DUF1289 domain-containing protein [Rhizorhabdus dicambivorans]
MAVPSPCTNICSIDPATGYCIGCLRTVEEIAGWGSSDDDGKRAVLERLKRRALRKD